LCTLHLCPLIYKHTDHRFWWTCSAVLAGFSGAQHLAS
jgi:hypothetical protein